MYDWKPQKGRLFTGHFSETSESLKPDDTEFDMVKSAFSMPVGAKMVITSQSARVEKEHGRLKMINRRNLKMISQIDLTWLSTGT